MVIGNGLIAKSFPEFINDDSVVIFASGVSNSSETIYTEYIREKNLLAQTTATFPNALIIYFSTISILDPSLSDSVYIQHKHAMENMLQKKPNKTLIFRLPNIVGHSSNPFTLTNYLYNQIKVGNTFVLYKNAHRYLMDIQDVTRLCKCIIKNNSNKKTVHISFDKPISVPKLVEIFENILNKKAHYAVEERGQYFSVPNDISLLIKESEVLFTENYYTSLIKKYYNIIK